jgi:hypothetical protein
MKTINAEFWIMLPLVTIGMVHADPLDIWTVRNPSPSDIHLFGVTYGNGKFVAVGAGIVTSADGVSWSLASEGTLTTLNAVTFGDGTFVAVGDDGAIRTSSDGIKWISRESGTTNALTAVTSGGSQFVALGPSGTILTSPDGVNWATGTTSSSIDFSAVTYGSGQFVAVGGDLAGGHMLTSSNGVDWVERGPEMQNGLLAVAYGNGKFVAISNPPTVREDTVVVTSTNGGTWATNFVNWVNQQSETQSIFLVLTYGQGQFVAVARKCSTNDCSATILTSNDGAAWSERQTEVLNPLSAVAYGGGQFVAVGSLGTILTSPDGVIWTKRQAGTRSPFPAITYGNGTFVAIGGISRAAFDAGQGTLESFTHTTLTSTDGTTWAAHDSGPEREMFCVAFGNGSFMAMGVRSRTFQTLALASVDGANWEERGSWSLLREGSPYGIAYGNGRFVTVGEGGGIFTSTNLFAEYDSFGFGSGNTSASTGVTFGNGQFVAVGDEGMIVSSADGVNWTRSSLGSTWSLNGITHGNGQYVIVGDMGGILASRDTVNWIECTSPTTNSLFGVAFGNGQYVAVGDLGTVVTSADGLHWVGRRAVTQNSLRGIAYGKGTFVAVGDDGTILQSGRAATLTLTLTTAGGAFDLALEVLPGLDYTVQSSTDLVSWRNLTKIINPQSSRIILEGVSTSSEYTFYRVYSP